MKHTEGKHCWIHSKKRMASLLVVYILVAISLTGCSKEDDCRKFLLDISNAMTSEDVQKIKTNYQHNCTASGLSDLLKLEVISNKDEETVTQSPTTVGEIRMFWDKNQNTYVMYSRRSNDNGIDATMIAKLRIAKDKRIDAISAKRYYRI